MFKRVSKHTKPRKFSKTKNIEKITIEKLSIKTISQFYIFPSHYPIRVSLSGECRSAFRITISRLALA